MDSILEEGLLVKASLLRRFFDKDHPKTIMMNDSVMIIKSRKYFTTYSFPKSLIDLCH